LRERWLAELAGLGYRDRDKPLQLALYLPGALDREAAVAEVVTRLGAGRSAWNAADLRGQVEQLLARAGIVAEQAVRIELAEDLTARALEVCVSLHEGATPEHIRALTSQHVLDVEADLVARLAARGAAAECSVAPAVEGLDAGQRAAVAALAGDGGLVVVEGAAGAGKTTLLAAARDQLDRQGRRLVVVTPTLKAAQAATAEVGARAGSAAWLAWQHGWRWDATGAWTRTPTGPAPELQRGDLLLVDEAGMLDQDTARALLTIADEAGARVALVGDRHQLPAVGRGGVLDLAYRWVHPDARVDLDTVHRFVRTVAGHTTPDSEYAELTLAMRAGDDPGAVFDALHAGGHIAVHGSQVERRDALADRLVATRRGGGRTATVVVDTRDHAATLNSAIRDRLVAAGAVDDRRVAVTRDGQRLGAGDVIVTRRNEHDLDVANREVWTVTRVHPTGRLTVDNPGRGQRELPADYVRRHVELGYAVTGYGAQGDTTTPKNHERRSVPLPRFIVKELTKHLAKLTADDLVFTSANGGVLRNRNARRDWFNPAAGAIAEPGLTPHELRHTAASLAVSAGANVKAVQRMLGHASAAMTLDRYADLFDDDLDAVAERLDAVYERATRANGEVVKLAAGADPSGGSVVDLQSSNEREPRATGERGAVRHLR
ncbi:MAG TPA: AAA family ATPase, partial [Nakamurella sp.]